MISKKDKGKINFIMNVHFGSQKGCINISSAYYLSATNITQILQVRMDERCMFVYENMQSSIFSLQLLVRLCFGCFGRK